MLDIDLFKGNLLVFKDFAMKFIKMVKDKSENKGMNYVKSEEQLGNEEHSSPK